MDRLKTFDEFWPFYIAQHMNRRTSGSNRG